MEQVFCCRNQYLSSMEINLETLQYPIGRFSMPASVSSAQIKEAIQKITFLPTRFVEVVRHMSKEQLDTPYRPEGWTIRQVVHHVPDSHMNAYVRFKLALTEDGPVIKPYEEAAWANLPDSSMGPEVSLMLLGAIHTRWVVIMEAMTDADWQRTFIHPQYNRTQTLAQSVMLYAWHGEHHLAHILRLKERL